MNPIIFTNINSILRLKPQEILILLPKRQNALPNQRLCHRGNHHGQYHCPKGARNDVRVIITTTICRYRTPNTQLLLVSLSLQLENHSLQPQVGPEIHHCRVENLTKNHHSLFANNLNETKDTGKIIISIHNRLGDFSTACRHNHYQYGMVTVPYEYHT